MQCYIGDHMGQMEKRSNNEMERRRMVVYRVLSLVGVWGFSVP